MAYKSFIWIHMVKITFELEILSENWFRGTRWAGIYIAGSGKFWNIRKHQFWNNTNERGRVKDWLFLGETKTKKMSNAHTKKQKTKNKKPRKNKKDLYWRCGWSLKYQKTPFWSNTNESGRVKDSLLLGGTKNKTNKQKQETTSQGLDEQRKKKNKMSINVAGLGKF